VISPYSNFSKEKNLKFIVGNGIDWEVKEFPSKAILDKYSQIFL
jgi:hypothetical protein